ncbi:MAG: DUF2953 domain-containing protein [Firmicutes bacterium]|nr:DUF2953 domain-containing protein [Bacillota bacterium]
MVYTLLILVPVIIFFALLTSSAWVEACFLSPSQPALRLRFGLNWGWKERRLVWLTVWRFSSDTSSPSTTEERKKATKKGGFKLPLSLRTLLSLLLKLLSGVRLNLTGRIRFSTGDPASTGLAAGAAWSFVGLGQSFIRTFCRGDRIKIELVPEFEEPLFEADIRCIVSVPVAHIISVGAQVVTYLRKEQVVKKKRGGKKRWQNIPFRA